jgi:hypothetical protein
MTNLILSYDFTDYTGASPFPFTLPLSQDGSNLYVDWGDNNTQSQTIYTHNFDIITSKNFTIEISVNNCTHLTHHNNQAGPYLISCDSFGEIGLTNLSYAFEKCSRLTYVHNLLPTTTIITMDHMFDGASVFNGDLGNWDFSGATNTSYMFRNAIAFTGDSENNWTNSSANTLMVSMFEGAEVFNGDLGNWNFSGATNTTDMFSNAIAFTGINTVNWVNSSANTLMSGMFDGASVFNGDLSNWNFSGTTNTSYMFRNAKAFTGINTVNWVNSSANTLMVSMFDGAEVFNGDLGNWNFSGATNTSYMFRNAKAFTGQNADTWNITNNLTNMTGMFTNTLVFDCNLGGWDVSVAIMTDILRNAYGMTINNYNQTLIEWYNKGYTSSTFTAKGLMYSQDANIARNSFATSNIVNDMYIESNYKINITNPGNMTFNGNSPYKTSRLYINNIEVSTNVNYHMYDDYILYEDITFPTIPSTGNIKIYVDLDNDTYFLGYFKQSDLTIIKSKSTPTPHTPHTTPISDICFVKNTPIETDQGIVRIQELQPFVHTIHNKPIMAITKTKTLDDFLICFEKNSLGKNYPSQRTIVSKHHKIHYQHNIISAYRFIGTYENVRTIPYNGEPLYNILMKKHSTVRANHLVCETLDPNSIIAQLYMNNMLTDKHVAVMNKHTILENKKKKLFTRLIHNM